MGNILVEMEPLCTLPVNDVYSVWADHRGLTPQLGFPGAQGPFMSTGHH